MNPYLIFSSNLAVSGAFFAIIISCLYQRLRQRFLYLNRRVPIHTKVIITQGFSGAIAILKKIKKISKNRKKMAAVATTTFISRKTSGESLLFVQDTLKNNASGDSLLSARFLAYNSSH